jgi:predicted TPR repeat methyltransferase
VLEKARVRGTYDELVAMELCGFMRSRPAAFDVVLSADTLVYFAALEQALEAAHGLPAPEWPADLRRRAPGHYR